MENARVRSVAADGDRPAVRDCNSALPAASRFAAPYGRQPIALHQSEEILAALVAQHLPDQGAQGMHVLA